jgi:hypothetical protein
MVLFGIIVLLLAMLFIVVAISVDPVMFANKLREKLVKIFDRRK